MTHPTEWEQKIGIEAQGKRRRDWVEFEKGNNFSEIKVLNEEGQWQLLREPWCIGQTMLFPE